MSARRWWRDNRFWLPALPFAVAAMLVASSYNVRFFWYEQGPHRELASAPAGEFVATTDDYDDALGPTSRSFRVRLDQVAATATNPLDDASSDDPSEVPAGTRAVRVTLDWEADPDQVLRGCTVALEDDEGRRYELVGSHGRANQCVPEGAEGPRAPVSQGEERGEVPFDAHRPPAWSTSPTFLVAEDAEITRVLVWWELPDHVALSAP